VIAELGERVRNDFDKKTVANYVDEIENCGLRAKNNA
jgi:hypothetical protein